MYLKNPQKSQVYKNICVNLDQTAEQF